MLETRVSSKHHVSQAGTTYFSRVPYNVLERDAWCLKSLSEIGMTHHASCIGSLALCPLWFSFLPPDTAPSPAPAPPGSPADSRPGGTVPARHRRGHPWERSSLRLRPAPRSRSRTRSG